MVIIGALSALIFVVALVLMAVVLRGRRYSKAVPELQFWFRFENGKLVDFEGAFSNDLKQGFLGIASSAMLTGEVIKYFGEPLEFSASVDERNQHHFITTYRLERRHTTSVTSRHSYYD